MQLLFGVAVAVMFIAIGYYWGRSAAQEKAQRAPKPQNGKQWNFDLSKEKAPSRLAGHSEGAKKTIQQQYTTLGGVCK